MKDIPTSELCRVVVNYKNNRHLYVEFGKNGFKPIDAQGTLVKLDDEWGGYFDSKIPIRRPADYE